MLFLLFLYQIKLLKMFKILLSAFFLLLAYQNSIAQITAITLKGDTIYAYNDGTWSYEMKDFSDGFTDEFDYLNAEFKVDTIDQKFTFPKSAEKEIDSELDFFKVKYNANDWKRVPAGQLNDEAEIAFTSKSSDIFCIIISEEIELGTENIAKIAINMMEENTGSDVEVRKQELRNVNGKDVLHVVCDLSLSGIKMTFDSYYYSCEAGTVQFSTWTGVNLHKRHEATIEGLLNGLIIND